MVFLLCGMVSADQYRTFTSADGRTMEAELSDFSSDGTISLRLKNGRSFTGIKPEIFSEEDRQYIAEWKLDTIVERGYLETKIRRTRDKVGEDDVGAIEEKIYEAGYSIEFDNGSSVTLEDLRVEYAILSWEAQIAGKRSDGEYTGLVGDVKITRLPAFEEVKVETRKITLRETDLASGYYWVGGGNSDSKDRLKGCWIRVWKGDKLIHEDSMPTGFRKNHKWSELKKKKQ